MSTITRTWLAFAALGTGMIHLALVISSPLPIAMVLTVFGVVEVAWGVMTFIRERIAAPRLVLAGALLPIGAWGLLVAAAAAFDNPELASSVGLTAMGIAAILELFVAGVIAVKLRRGTDFSAPSRMPRSAAVYLGGLMVGGVLVAGLTTPALAATEAGIYAQPHGEHSDTFQPKIDEEIILNLPDHHTK